MEKIRHCTICSTETVHEQGNYKCHDINGKLFELSISVDDALKSLGDNFNNFSKSENLTVVNKGDVLGYLHSENGRSGLSGLFAQRIRAMKCEKCGHLLKIGRLP